MFRRKMIRSQLQAQHAVCCEMCDAKSSVRWYCMNCGEYLCEICKSMHTRTKHTRNCTVIPRDLFELKSAIENISSERVCPDHINETIKLVCKTCGNIEVCFQCVLDSHCPLSQHNVELIVITTSKKVDERQQKKIKWLESKLKSKLRHCGERLSELSDEIEQSQRIKADLVFSIHARADALAQEVTNAKQKMLQRVDKLFSDSQTHLLFNRDKCSNCRLVLEDITAQLQQKQESVDPTDLQTFTRENIAKFMNAVLPEKPDNSFSFSLVPKGTVDDIFGSLSSERVKQEAPIRGVKTNLYSVEVLASVHTQNSRGIGKICPVSDQMAWIAHSNRTTVEKIDKSGKTVRLLETPFPVQDIDVNSDKDMVLTSEFTVWSKDLMDETSAFRNIRNCTPFVLKGITLMTGQNILVCAQLKNDPGKVVRLSWEGEVIMEIRDVTEDPVLRDPYRVAHSIFNDDIALACSDKVLVYTKTGDLKSKWAGLRSEFNPHGITYDNHGNILVSCYKNNLVYMLAEDEPEDGHVLLDGQKHTMVTNPWAVAVDVSGRLWLAGYQGVIHIIKYNTSYQ